MDTVPGLKQLEARKRELLLESEINRQILRVEAGRLSFQAGQFRRGYAWAQGAWKWALPVAGFLFARRFKKASGAVAKGSMLVAALRAGWKAWQFFQERRAGAGPRP